MAGFGRAEVAGARPGAAVTVAEVDAVRALLRRSASSARAEALREVRAWSDRPWERAAATVVLRSAGERYPSVDLHGEDVGAALVRALWPSPWVTSVRDVVPVYLQCSRPARLALLRLLGLRDDDRSAAAVADLVAVDGPWELLPAPDHDLLGPLARSVGPGAAGRLAMALAPLVWRGDWSEHATALCAILARRGVLHPEADGAVAGVLGRRAAELVEAADRLALRPVSADDLGRADRRRLGALVGVLADLCSDPASVALRRVLASADPRVAVMGAVAMLRRGEPVAGERLALLARDPRARLALVGAVGLDALGSGAAGGSLRVAAGGSVLHAVAEAEVVDWLCGESALGVAPDEIEPRGDLEAPGWWGPGRVLAFAFRLRPPHEAAAQGWMLAAVGPFPDPGDPTVRGDWFAAHSLFRSDEALGLPEHVLAIAEDLAAGRDRGR